MNSFFHLDPHQTQIKLITKGSLHRAVKRAWTVVDIIISFTHSGSIFATQKVTHSENFQNKVL